RPRRHRCSGERGQRLLLSTRDQGDVFRRTDPELPYAPGRAAFRDGSDRLPRPLLLLHRWRAACRSCQCGNREPLLGVAAFSLPRKAVDAGYRVIGYEAIGSTNEEALDAARQGDPGQLWIAALQQTQGRGRRGRLWHSPYGNLAASLLVVPDAPSEALAALGFVAGVALNGALAELAPQMRLASGLDGTDGTQCGAAARI